MATVPNLVGLSTKLLARFDSSYQAQQLIRELGQILGQSLLLVLYSYSMALHCFSDDVALAL